jgi:cytochrome c oxidase cbb3-type subunit 3
MLSSFWNIFIIIVTIASILGCWWLLYWTKGISDREDDTKIHDTGHVWDHDIRELNHPLPRWWLHLFNITIVFALVYLLLYPGLGNLPGVLGWTQLNRYADQVELAASTEAEAFAAYADMEPGQLIADAGARETGRRLFGNHCAMCHGSDGRGGPGFPNLADSEWLYGNDFAAIQASIDNGRQGVMPPWGAALGEQGADEMVAHVLSLSGQAADATLAQAGAQKFGMFCAACHGPEGKGNPALGAPDLRNDIWLHGGDAVSIRTTIMDGRQGLMPAHRELLSDDRRRLLAAYVAGLGQRGD